MQILGGYVIATPTTLGPDDLPQPLWTISPCLLAGGIEETLAQAFRTERADWWARNPVLASSGRGKRETSSDEPGLDDFFHLLDQHRPLPPDAEILGHELVGLEVGFTFHSWHCFPYADERRVLGVTLASDGLLADHDDARRVLDHIRQDPPYEIPWTVASLAVLGR
ncbi:hypothetical protein ACFCV3_06065 [Kribbella sp. NPDC056345]|uniref:hypothetical protein n=1 Tax=Kribbella sp. NPDC056345 TaxID=3345789 RepID=UPI0035E0D0D1